MSGVTTTGGPVAPYAMERSRSASSASSASTIEIDRLMRESEADKRNIPQDNSSTGAAKLPHQHSGGEEQADERMATHHHHIHGVGLPDLHISIDRLDIKKLAFLGLYIFILFPLLALAVSTIFGGLLAWAEGTSFSNGFLYIISIILGMANPLTEYAPEVGAVVILIDLYTRIAELVCFGIMLNVVNLFQVPDKLNELIRKFIVRDRFLVPLIALGIIIPAWNAGLCAIFGAILALVESWHVREGIFYVLTNTLGLATPLTDTVPTTLSGKVVDIVLSSVVLGYTAIFADYVTTLNPSSSVRMKARKYLIRMGVVDRRTSVAHPLAHHDRCDNGGEEIGISVTREESLAVES